MGPERGLFWILKILEQLIFRESEKGGLVFSPLDAAAVLHKPQERQPVSRKEKFHILRLSTSFSILLTYLHVTLVLHTSEWLLCSINNSKKHLAAQPD